MRLRGTAGIYASETELLERVDFTYPGSENTYMFPLFKGEYSTGFAPNG